MWLGPNAMSTWDWFSCSVKLTQRLPECISKGPTFHSSAFRFVAFLSASVRGPKWHCGGCSTHRAPAMAIKSQGLDIKWFENNVFIYLMLTLKNDLKMIAYTSFCSLINNLWYVDLVWFNYIYIYDYIIYTWRVSWTVLDKQDRTQPFALLRSIYSSLGMRKGTCCVNEWSGVGNQQIEMKLYGRCPPEFPGAPRNDLASTTHSHNDGCWAFALLLWCSAGKVSWRNPGQLQVQAMPITSVFSQSALPWHTLNESLIPLKSKTSSNACKDELPRHGLQHLS